MLNADASAYGCGVGNTVQVEARPESVHGQPASIELRVPPLERSGCTAGAPQGLTGTAGSHRRPRPWSQWARRCGAPRWRLITVALRRPLKAGLHLPLPQVIEAELTQVVDELLEFVVDVSRALYDADELGSQIDGVEIVTHAYV